MAKKARAQEDNSSPEEYWNSVLHREFDGESDRASVILGAALLDAALDTLLRARLTPVASGDDSLLDGAYAPISSFSARIDLAFRIGLISSKFARDLHLVRKVRNSFAHNVTGCTFEEAAVRSRVQELMRSTGYAERQPEMRTGFPIGPRGDFQMAVSLLQWSLRADLADVYAIEEASPEFPYLDFDDDDETSDEATTTTDKPAALNDQGHR